MKLRPTFIDLSLHRVSSVDSERLVNLSPSSQQESSTDSRCNATTRVPAPLIALPPLRFTYRSHFVITGTTITRSEVDLDASTGEIILGVLDSSTPVPKLGVLLGWDVKDSVAKEIVCGWRWAWNQILEQSDSL
ncbi:hypothetical protein BLNAU_21463 [Blattamonas nauphoetae]|uniref:Uncharacterized protein n=1 Tax=Blattamonas nauphoetae TaxID=2049346 RepID=A0ABQ9WYZ0_9EUKA|nr:hypothetical protein BLNAU_21463 [Blattamonas nauphoetae]